MAHTSSAGKTFINLLRTSLSCIYIILTLLFSISEDLSASDLCFSCGEENTAMIPDSSKKTLNHHFDTLKPPHKVINILKTNPLAPLWGNIPLTSEWNINYELVSGRNKSILVGLSFLGKGPIWKLVEVLDTMMPDANIRGVRFQMGWRTYFDPFKPEDKFLEYSPQGMYIMPHLSYSAANLKFPAYLRSSGLAAQKFSASLILGYQFIIDNWVLDLYCGGGYKKMEFQELHTNGKRTIIPPEEFGPFVAFPVRIAAGFQIGIGF